MLAAEKLMLIQQELKAPKGQYNSFGKYKYRSCEDILEAVKPLLGKNKAALTISDSLIYMGDRYYIQATASLVDAETGETISNTAYARESLEKKGMDDSQITGTASSYARKYALNGLFCIDDTKDADTDEYENSRQGKQGAEKAQRGSASGSKAQSGRGQGKQQAQQKPQEAQPAPQPAPQPAEPQAPVYVNANHIASLRSEMVRTGVAESAVLAMAKVGSLEEIPMEKYMKLMNKFQRTPDRVPPPAPEDDFMNIPDGADQDLPFN